MGGGSAMPRFFVERDAVRNGVLHGDGSPGKEIVISGEDAAHISLSLRSKPGEYFTVCCEGTEYSCRVRDITKNEVFMEVLAENEVLAEPNVEVTLYQAFVKSDKFESVVQKSVELGVSRIVPVVMQRCVSRPDGASSSKKITRWQKIAKEAAMQSGRSIVPKVCEPKSFDEAIKSMNEDDGCFACYEDMSHTPLSAVLKKIGGEAKTVSFLIGPEGGISDEEVEKLRKENIPLAGLGRRILRTETAPLCVLSVLMMATGNLD